MNKLNQLLSANLKRLRREKNISQDYLALKMGISQATYSDIENNKIRFPIDKVENITHALDIGIDDLFNGIINQQKYQQGAVRNQSSFFPSDLEIVKNTYEQLINEKDKTINYLHKVIVTLESNIQDLRNQKSNI
jgi:transcriptional regulator with XRE-family HTH domain